jgi:pimeloyl-ACP methyl ester carboxylesterase
MKRTVSAILVVVLMFTACVPAFAAPQVQTSEPTAPEYPLVVIRGVNFMNQYLDIGTENERSYIPPIKAGDIFSTFMKGAAKYMVSFDKQKFLTPILDYVNETFKYVACDKNGDSIYNVGVDEYPLSAANYEDYPLGDEHEDGILSEAVNRYGAEYVYYFNYDWRIDPLDAAVKIDEMINRALSDHGCDKVNIIACSMGGVMTVGYLYEYGYEKVNKIVMLSSAFCGTYMLSDVFQGKLRLNPTGAYNLLKYGLNLSFPIKILVDILQRTGFIGRLCNFMNGFISDEHEFILDYTFRDTFGSIPSWWAMVLNDEIDACVDYMFPTAELKAEYAGLLERIDRIHAMLDARDELLRSANEDGVGIFVLANYNMPLYPFYERSTSFGDGLETALMAGGAQTADFGTTLDVPETEFLSPDKMVDVTNVLFPDSTWIIKNAPHVPCKVGSEFAEFLFVLIDTEENMTVYSNPLYPRFLCVDNNQNFVEYR